MMARPRHLQSGARMRTYSAVVAILLIACGTKGDEANIPERQYVAVEVLRIGSLDDSASAFTWFRELEVGPNGDIYTFHGQEHNIRVHSAEGRLIRTIGRQGEGPGEFKGSGRMGILGDSRWVLDFGTYRYSFFRLGPAGSLLGAVRLPVGLYAYAADVNQIWGMEQDELDVPYIVSYRVGSTGEPG